MRKLIATLLLAGSLTLGVSAVALADPPATNPGADCSHGNSGQTCVPDPQPEHGQECDEHGAPNPAGNDGNEDHCSPTPSPSTSPSPSPEPSESPSPSPSTSPTSPPSVTPSPEPSPTSSPSPSTSTSPPGPSSPPPSVGPSQPPKQDDVVKPELNRKLAFTGTEDTLLLGALAFALLLAGTWLWRKGSKL